MKLSTTLVFLCGQVGCAAILGIPDAALDSDGDTLVDTDDNCKEIYNPGQFDEDRDGIGNECDNCPLIGNPQQENESELATGNDADDLGDACDPEPELMNQLILFESFDSELKADEWQSTMGDWKTTDGALRQSSRLSRASIYYRPVVGNDLLRIEVVAEYRNPASRREVSAIFRGGGILFETSADEETGYGCWTMYNLDDDFQGYTVPKFEQIAGSIAITFIPSGSVMRAFVENESSVHTAEIDGQVKRCIVRDLNSEPPFTANTRSDGEYDGDGVGLMTSYTEATFHYIYVITINP
ncbi:MAG: hypothetical protein MJE77_26890 [Proteobacteria bacterium]|nr:hypothetical protein [Pseudomonadota bacterium]